MLRNLRPSTPIARLLTLIALVAASVQTPAATYLWDVATPGANNWNVNANWLPNTGNPGAADTALFGDVGTSPDAVTVNNVVSVNTTVSALTFTNTSSVTTGPWHVTEIPASVTLTVTNLTVGLGASTPGTGLKTLAAVTGGGTLLGYGTLTAGNSGTSGANPGTALDLSGLTAFIWSNSAATLNIANVNRSAVDLKLAASSNSITAATMNYNTGSSGNGVSGSLTLGAGTNIFNVSTLNISAGRSTTIVAFPGGTGGLRIRGTGGTDADLCSMTLGNRNTGGSGSPADATLNLNGHPVDMRLGTFRLGLGSGTPTATVPANATLSFDTGTVFANSIAMAIASGNGNATANGTINVGAGGTLIVGAGGFSLVNQSTATNGAAAGTLNVNGGTLISSNSIVKTTAFGTGTIVMNSGTSTMAGGTIGAAAIPVDTLSMGDSVLNLAVGGTATNVNVANLTMTSTTNNVINISALPVITSYPVQFPLIRYASGSSDCLLGSLPPGYAGSLVNGVGSVDLLVSSGPITIRPLTWNGTPDGDWNTTTANWLYLGNPTAYSQGDFVTMNDSAAGTTTVNLTSTLTPGSLTVSNNTKNYTFNGIGSIGGTTSLVKDGSGQLTIANSGANTFSNGVSILNGSVLLSGSADRLPTSGAVTLADVATANLDLNSLNQTLQTLNGGGSIGGNLALGSGNLTVWGGGGYGGVVSGSGQMIKTNYTTGGTLTLSNANTYTGGTIVGGFTNNTTLTVANPTGSGTGSGFVRVLTNGTFSIGTGGAGGSVAALVITNDGIVRVSRSDEIVFTNIVVGAGALEVEGGGTVVINGTNGYTGGTTIDGARLLISNPGAVGSGLIFADNSNPGVLQLSNNIALSNPLRVASKPNAAGQVPNIENVSGTNTLSGPITMTANGAIGWGFYATAGKLIVAGNTLPVLPSATSQNTSRILQLRGDAVGEWTGNISNTVNSVTNVAVFKAGTGTWILAGQNDYSGKTSVTEGTMLYNGSLTAASSIVEVSGGTLGGNGTINRAVTTLALGTLAPGNSIGTLTVSNTLTLFGTTIMEVSHSSHDQIRGISTLDMQGGALQIVVVGSLVGGEQFKLFEASTYTGNFGAYDLPTLPSPLGWDSSTVATDGILKVTGGAPVLNFSQSGNVLTFQWTEPGFKLQGQTNSLSVGISSNWGDYPGGVTSPVNVTINPANPTVFFRLINQ